MSRQDLHDVAVHLRNGFASPPNIKAQQLIKEYNKARSPDRKTRLFYALFARYLRKRNIKYVNQVVGASAVVLGHMEHVVADVHGSTSSGQPSMPREMRLAGVPTRLRRFARAACAVKLLRSADYVAAAARTHGLQDMPALTVQATLAFIHTILAVSIHDAAGEHSREMLVRLAQNLHIPRAARLKYDQLALQIFELAEAPTGDRAGCK